MTAAADSALVLIGGGVRSGKSSLALRLARRAGPRRALVATAEAGDDEMRARIERHKQERAGQFDTLEEPVELETALGRLNDYDAVVVDCLTLWLSNLLLRGDAAADILGRVDALCELALPYRLIIVSNEVGMGIVPQTPLGRAFRDLAGRAHQRLSRRADELYFATMGVALRLRPEPVTTSFEESCHE